MIQVNSADDANSYIGSTMQSALSGYNSSFMSILNILPITGASVDNVINNTEAICPIGKIPNDIRTACICATGYASSSTSLCTACAVGFYKSITGYGNCITCPIGTTSKIASSFCTNIIDGTIATQNAINSSNLPIIVGGVVGGVILVGLLIFGMIRLTNKS